jgi:hypothetical protein
MICQIRGGKWLPFNLAMVEAAPDAVDAFLPVRTGATAVLVAIADVAPRQLQDIRWYAQRHRCAAFLRGVAARREERAAQREGVDSLAEALAEHFGLTDETEA